MPGGEMPVGVGNTSGDVGALCARHVHDTVHCLRPPLVGKCILYVLGPPFVWGAKRCRRVAAFPCKVIK